MRTALWLVVMFSASAASGQTLQQPALGFLGVGTTSSAPTFGGITINASGVVSNPKSVRLNADLVQKNRLDFAQRNLSADMAQPSRLRKISLARLERELRRAVDEKQSIDLSLRCLAGLNQIEFIYADQERGDLIIAGPAEGFAVSETGTVVGIETGRPTMLLDDLVVMLRLPNSGQALGCSFDPDKTRLADAQAWYQSTGAANSPADARRMFRQMADRLGNWNVSIFGLPPTSHAAISMVEADFLMKRINLGLHRTGIRGFRSQLAMMKPDDNSMRRFWFAPRYSPIERSADGAVFRLSGPRLQLLAQEELADAQGNRSNAAFTEVSTQDYTRQFNRHMDELCQRHPSFAAVQNLFDLAVTVALIRDQQLCEQINWRPTLLLDQRRLSTARYQPPTEVPSQLNTRTAGRGLMLFQIGGGVRVVASDVVANLTEPTDQRTPEVAPTGEAWWWD